MSDCFPHTHDHKHKPAFLFNSIWQPSSLHSQKLLSYQHPHPLQLTTTGLQPSPCEPIPPVHSSQATMNVTMLLLIALLVATMSTHAPAQMFNIHLVKCNHNTRLQRNACRAQMRKLINAMSAPIAPPTIPLPDELTTPPPAPIAPSTPPPPQSSEPSPEPTPEPTPDPTTNSCD
jgi:hypothetical protein